MEEVTRRCNAPVRMLGTAPRVHAPPLTHGQGTWADSLIDEIVNGPPRPNKSPAGSQVRCTHNCQVRVDL